MANFVFVPEREAWTTETTMNDRGLLVKNHTQIHRVESDELVDPYVAESALLAELAYGPFGVHPFDPAARLKGIHTALDPKNRDPWIYRSSIQFGSDAPTSDQPNRQEENPLDDNPEVAIDGEVMLFPMFRDLEDKLVANSAMQPVTGVNEERAIEICTIYRNEAVRDSARDREFRNTVNKFTWSGAAPGTLKITRIRADRQFRNTVLFWRYFYEIRYNEKGWQPSLLNAGTKQYVRSGGGINKVDCTDSEGQPVTEPVPLDDFGTQIIESALPDAAVYNKFKTLKETDFMQLNLPTSG